ncbi:hypothetical protein P7C73_g1066, partial [Tremellales sp. Uapishka_1]
MNRGTAWTVGRPAYICLAQTRQNAAESNHTGEDGQISPSTALRPSSPVPSSSFPPFVRSLAMSVPTSTEPTFIPRGSASKQADWRGWSPNGDPTVSSPNVYAGWPPWLPDLTQGGLESIEPAGHQQAASSLIDSVPMSTGEPDPNGAPNPLNKLLRRAESEEGSVLETVTGLAMISLEAAAEPHYVGESSGSFWSSVISKGMCTSPEKSSRIPSVNAPAPLPSPHHHAMLRAELQRPIPNEVADRVLESVYQHLHARARDGILLAVAQDRQLNKEAATAAFFILMVLAIGGQLCNEKALMRPEDYHTLAASYVAVIVQLHNLTNVQGLLLLAMYSLRDSRGPSVWYLSGVAVRLAALSFSKYHIEMRKRVFWSWYVFSPNQLTNSYVLDRMMVMLLGRPPGISDDDIDIDLPEPIVFNTNISVPSMRSSSMVSAIHYLKLIRIDSQIQRTIYTVSSRRHNGIPVDPRPLLNTIDRWENEIPPDASSPTSSSLPCCSRDWFELRGVEARLHLLRPLNTSIKNGEFRTLPLLAKKRVHHAGQPTSSTSLHSTFICGLALLHSVFLQPTVLPLKDIFSAIKAASNTLFAYSQGQVTSGALYDIFEQLSGVCIDRITRVQTGSPDMGMDNAVDEWQRVSEEATSGIGKRASACVADDQMLRQTSTAISCGV